MTGNTKKIANQIENNFKNLDVTAKSINISSNNFDRIENKIKEADIILWGSSTKYGDLVGGIEEVLEKVKDMELKGKFTAVFGSYGWSGEAIEIINDYLVQSSMKIIDSSYLVKKLGVDSLKLPFKIKFNPTVNELEKLEEITQIIKDILYQ